MGEGGVTQVDRDAAADYFELIGEANRAIVARRGQYDLSACVQAFARHRQAAEKAQQERDAGIAERYPSNKWHSKAIFRGIATAIRSQGHE